MSKFIPSVVIPCGANRLENLKLVLQHLTNQTFKPRDIIIVCDGFNPREVSSFESCGHEMSQLMLQGINILATYNEKHVAGSGTTQPKNAGVNKLVSINSEATHVWFLDSDIIVGPDCLEMYKYAHTHDYGQDRIMIGPYEWLPAGVREVTPELKNDPRWDMFDAAGHRTTTEGDISYALANFGGNIVYPIQAFLNVGGFWDELSAGRVEDGEMGLRFCQVGQPMTTVARARGYHLDHPVNHQWKLDTNTKEVPMLNARHPWVENHGIYVSDNDGKRFEWIDPKTGEHKNTLEIWRNYEKSN